MQTKNVSVPFELVESNLENLRRRLPGLPVSGILLCRLLMHLGREMAVMFEHQLRPSGLAEAEFRVLTTLFSQPEGVAHPSDLCARASQSPANMSRISDALVDRGFITRVSSVHDRRRIVLRITGSGETFVRDLFPRLFVPLREMLKSFPETEQRQITSQLKRLAVEMEQGSRSEVEERKA